MLLTKDGSGECAGVGVTEDRGGRKCVIHSQQPCTNALCSEKRERKGKERKGRERKGKEGKGKEGKGKERKGKERKGFEMVLRGG